MVGRERLQDHIVDGVDVVRIARHRDPAKRPDALTEQGADIKVDEGPHPEGVLDARGLGLRAQAVAIFEHDGAAIEKIQHGAKMRADRAPRQSDQLLRIALAHRARLFERQFRRHIAFERIGKGLIGDDIGQDAAPRQFRQDDRGVGA